MKVNVTEKEVVIAEYSPINEGEVMVNKCEFILPESFKNLTVTASFNNIPVPIINSSCYIPSLKKGTVTLGVYAYKEALGEVELMYSPRQTTFFVQKGSFSDEIGVENIPSVSEYEQYCNQVKNAAVIKEDLVKEFTADLADGATKTYSAKAVNEALSPNAPTPLNNVISNNLKKTKSNKTGLFIDDISPVKHTLDLYVTGRIPISELPKVTIKKISKNIFTFKGRQVRTVTEGESMTNYLDTKGIFIGMSPDELFTNTTTAEVLKIDEVNDSITIKYNTQWRGVCFDVKVNEEQYYSISYSSGQGPYHMRYGFLDSGGKVISDTSTSQCGDRIFTPKGTEFLLVDIFNKTSTEQIEIRNFQIEAGSYPTDFEPYTVLQEKPLVNRHAYGITSEYPITNLLASNSRAVLRCTYNVDINKAYNELKNAIVSLGGNI